MKISLVSSAPLEPEVDERGTTASFCWSRAGARGGRGGGCVGWTLWGWTRPARAGTPQLVWTSLSWPSFRCHARRGRRRQVPHHQRMARRTPAVELTPVLLLAAALLFHHAQHSFSRMSLPFSQVSQVAVRNGQHRGPPDNEEARSSQQSGSSQQMGRGRHSRRC